MRRDIGIRRRFLLVFGLGHLVSETSNWWRSPLVVEFDLSVEIKELELEEDLILLR